jgi:hypothetical protein
MSKKEILVTIPFESLITQLFGQERRYYVPLETVIADVIEYHIKQSNLHTLYKIQRSSFAEISRFIEYKEVELSHPRLWVYSDWYDSEQNYNRLKKNSDKDRFEREALSRNIRLVMKYYKEFTGVDNDEIAEAKCYALVKDNKLAAMKMLGVPVEKLITKKEQL